MMQQTTRAIDITTVCVCDTIHNAYITFAKPGGVT